MSGPRPSCIGGRTRALRWRAMAASRSAQDPRGSSQSGDSPGSVDDTAQRDDCPGHVAMLEFGSLRSGRFVDVLTEGDLVRTLARLESEPNLNPDANFSR